MTEDKVDIILQPSGTPKVAIKPTRKERNMDNFRKRANATTEKIFCAKRELALALLEDFILVAGAYNDIINGKATEEQIMKVVQTTQTFVIDLSDRLMIDCGLTEKDIESVVTKIQAKTPAEGKTP